MGNQLTVADFTDNIKKMEGTFNDSIPLKMREELNGELVIRLALTAVKSNPDLMKCEPKSIYKSLTESCQLGLTIDGVLGHAYLVPYGKVCTLIPGYKGLKKLVRNTGEVRIFKTGCVYKGDDFDYQTVPFSFRHKHGDNARVDDNDITHVYTWWELANGACDASVWTYEKAKKHQNQYGGKSPAWKNSFPAMSEKSNLRSVINSGAMPTSSVVQAFVARADEYDREITVHSTVVTNKPTELSQLQNKFAPPVDAIESSVIVESTGKDLSMLETAINACKACENQDDLSAVQSEFELKLETDDQFELNQVCVSHAETIQK